MILVDGIERELLVRREIDFFFFENEERWN